VIQPCWSLQKARVFCGATAELAVQLTPTVRHLRKGMLQQLDEARSEKSERNACLVIARDKSESNMLPVPVPIWSEPKLLLPLNGQAQTSALYPDSEIAQTALLSRS